MQNSNRQLAKRRRITSKYPSHQISDLCAPKWSADPLGGGDRICISSSNEAGSAKPPGSSTDSSLPETTSLMDMITEAVRIVHQFCKYPHEVPRAVHSRILQTLRHDNHEAIADLNQWSDGSIWMQVLEMGSTQKQKVTILNMLEYMGAWEWYDSQTSLSQRTVCTKKGKPVDRKGAAIHVLNRMQSIRLDTTAQGRWISGVGRVTLGEEEGSADLVQETGEGVSLSETGRCKGGA